MARLYLIRGLPGSGKTTFAKSLDIFHVEQDMFLVRNGEYVWGKHLVKNAVAFCQGAALNAMLLGIDLVVSNTFTRLFEMQIYLDMAKHFNYEVCVFKACGTFGSVHNVPEEAMKAMKNRWEAFEGEVLLNIEK